jgi:hypothetical protein
MKSHLRLIAIGFVITTCSFAQQLILTQTGTGSGEIKTLDGGGNWNAPIFTFTDAAFTLTSIVDTANRHELWTAQSERYGYAIHNSLVSIEIAGVGNFTVTYPGTQSIVNNLTGGFAFCRDEHGAESDLFDGPADSAFLTWDMLTGIGPISGTGSLLQWGEIPWIYTSGGYLFFTSSLSDHGAFPMTFTAQVAVPEPSACAALAGLGVLGFATYRKRHRQVA